MAVLLLVVVLVVWPDICDSVVQCRDYKWPVPLSCSLLLCASNCSALFCLSAASQSVYVKNVFSVVSGAL